MTEYWISNERHYCKECGCWMDGKKSSIKRHEEGFRHKGNVERLLKKLKRDKILANKEANKHKIEFAAIERAAKKQYIKDCANGLNNNNNNNNNNYHLSKKCKDNNYNLFLGTDNDIYYYLDKDGVVHGPYKSSKMCIWYHFGFFVGALRIRKREETDFIHLRNIKNPFNYQQFLNKFNTNIKFKNNVINSIDITNANTIPPGIDIPQKLKDEFHRIYPKELNNINKRKHLNENKNERFKQHQYYSDGVNFTRSNNMNGTKKEQRKLFIRGQMRKYKMKCNCGDSDCHLKHNHDQNDDIDDDVDDDDNININNNTETQIEKREVDQFGFGKWETVTKEEFDKKHSNQHLFKQKANSKKRWWRDQINSNLPIAKRKKLMGIDEDPSDDDRDYDDEYEINEILKQKELMDNNNNNKIAISICTKFKTNNNDKNQPLNEEDIMIKDAKLKLKKMKQEQLKKVQEKKVEMLATLNDNINVNDNLNNNKDQIEEELKFKQEQNINKGRALFKKKKKKNRKQQGRIATSMR